MTREIFDKESGSWLKPEQMVEKLRVKQSAGPLTVGEKETLDTLNSKIAERNKKRLEDEKKEKLEQLKTEEKQRTTGPWL